MNSQQLQADDMVWTTDAAPAALHVTLNAVEQFIRTFVVLSDEQATATALWVAHTHAFSAAECTPYLQITSATKRAGKTRLLEVLEPLVKRPCPASGISAAALYRTIEEERPTLLFDETDATFKGDRERAEATRGILNGGYRSSGCYRVCVGQNTSMTAKKFSTFCPKALAGIGELPDTVADRSIRIELRRRTATEACSRWRERDGHAAAAPIHEALARWAAPAVSVLKDARPVIPSSLGDRQADVWEPLLAIAELAGEGWPAAATKAAIVLSGGAEDQDIVVELLRDVAEILQDETDDVVIPTQTILDKLKAMDDKPWATWRHDKPITARGLARLLGPLGIHPTRLETRRGYRRDAFDDAIARYLPSQASSRQDPNENGLESPISMSQPSIAPDGLKTAKSPVFIEQMTLGHIEAGKREADDERF